MFAKLYETAEHGQILVKIDSSSDECVPEVKIYFEPHGLGVCSIGIKFEDNDNGWDKAEKLFNSIDEKKAANFIGEQFDRLSQVS